MPDNQINRQSSMSVALVFMIVCACIGSFSFINNSIAKSEEKQDKKIETVKDSLHVIDKKLERVLAILEAR